jgi:hypothetical protein
MRLVPKAHRTVAPVVLGTATGLTRGFFFSCAWDIIMWNLWIDWV